MHYLLLINRYLVPGYKGYYIIFGVQSSEANQFIRKPSKYFIKAKCNPTVSLLIDNNRLWIELHFSIRNQALNSYNFMS